MNHKYRGKTFSGKEIKGSLILSEDGSRSFIGYIELIDKGRVTVVHYEEVRPETVSQYTGLKDKNGVKLAAGDKYKWLGWEVRDGKQIRPERIETIRNDTPEHWIEDCHRLWWISTGNSQGTVEIIGSIHEEAQP